jgi:hypothetical protein
MILSAYFDESGTHAGSRVLCVAGYLSTPERWVAFERDWKSALKDCGIPFFHMVDFANHAPPYYSGWSHSQRRVNYSRLVDIIKKRTLGSVGVCVPIDLYDKYVAPEVKGMPNGKPYCLAAATCFLDVATLVKQRAPAALVAYVLESGALGAGEILRQFQENINDPITKDYLRLLSLSFGDKRELVPLQAADILAYELYKHLPRQEGAVLQLPRNNLRMLRFGDMKWVHLNAESFANFSVVISAKARMSADRKGGL